MKITLEYNDDGENGERDEAINALHALDYKMIVWDFENELRGKRKYGEYSDETHEVLDELWDRWHDIKAERGWTDD